MSPTTVWQGGTTTTSSTMLTFIVPSTGVTMMVAEDVDPPRLPPLWIVVEAGDVFAGTEEDWQAVFFENATADEITAFCRDNDWSVEITPR